MRLCQQCLRHVDTNQQRFDCKTLHHQIEVPCLPLFFLLPYGNKAKRLHQERGKEGLGGPGSWHNILTIIILILSIMVTASIPHAGQVGQVSGSG